MESVWRLDSNGTRECKRRGQQERGAAAAGGNDAGTDGNGSCGNVEKCINVP